MSRGHWCETAALLPHVPGMGLGPWLWGDLQEREQRAQVDEGAEMKGDEKLHGGLGSCRALASQDGQHPTPTAGTENTHPHPTPVPFPWQPQHPPSPPHPIPTATAEFPHPVPHSHGNCSILLPQQGAGDPCVVLVPLWLQQEPTARGAKGGSSKVPGDPVQTSAHFPWCAGRSPRTIGTPGTHEDAEIHLGQGYTGPHV